MRILPCIRCNKLFKQHTSNPTEKHCSKACADATRKDREKRLRELRTRYLKMPKMDLKAICYIKDMMQLDNPTDNQIKDISNYYKASWKNVKANLDLIELKNTSNRERISYFNFKFDN